MAFFFQAVLYCYLTLSSQSQSLSLSLSLSLPPSHSLSLQYLSLSLSLSVSLSPPPPSLFLYIISSLSISFSLCLCLSLCYINISSTLCGLFHFYLNSKSVWTVFFAPSLSHLLNVEQELSGQNDQKGQLALQAAPTETDSQI